MDGCSAENALENNRPALSKLREGLAKECRVPIEFNQDFYFQHVGTMSESKSLLLNLKIEAMVATSESRMNDAAEAGLDCIRFGNAIARGGLMLDALVGQACRKSGMAYLTDTLTNYDAQTCRRIANEVVRIDSGMESPRLIIDRDRQWSREVYSIFDQVGYAIQERSLTPGKKFATSFEANYLRDQNQLRLLVLSAATHGYELDKGRRPGTAADLVPEYLSTVPKDALSGKLLILPSTLAPQTSGGK